MEKPGKPNGGSHGNGTSETLSRIARLISGGEETPEPDRTAEPEDDEGIDPSQNDDRSPELEEIASNRLLEALPAGLAVFQGATLLNANSAFALAFGYRDAAELVDAGGSLFTGSGADLEDRFSQAQAARGQKTELEARTRSGRIVSMPVAVHAIASESGAQARLMVLHPQSSVLSETPAAGQQVAASQDRAPGTGGRKAPAHQGNTATPGKKKKKKKSKGPKDKKARVQNADPPDMSEFLARVSHELRTPLNSIIGFAELMKDEQLGPVGNERYRGYIRDIHDSGIYALSIVNDLLDISKIRSGEVELNFTAVDVKEVIAESVQSMQPQAQRRRVLLRTSFADGLPQVLADRRSVRQIILNLVSNAIKFTMPGGQVIVSVLQTESGGVRIRVRDTGIGMSKTEVADAMKPYRQVDNPGMPHQPGTGLGLPLTKALVEANRARFKVRSTAGSGTRVDVTFPRERVAGLRG